MEKLTPEQQAEIKKMSSARLALKLRTVDVEEEAINAMDREGLMARWAQCIMEGRDKPKEPDASLQYQSFEFEKWKYQKELEYRQLEEERRQELERLEHEQQEDKTQRELERQKWEREIRLRELKLREEELSRLERLDKKEQEKRESLAVQSKFFGEVLTNIIWKFPHDAADIPLFFDHIENLFDEYEVPANIQARLLHAQLTEKAKALTARLSKDQSADYKQLKDFLLSEYKLSPQQYRQRFLNATNQSEETYALFASCLKNMLLYYAGSHGIDQDFDKFVSLVVADRLKTALPEHCLKFILAQEGDSWLSDQGGPPKLSMCTWTRISLMVAHAAQGQQSGGHEKVPVTGPPPLSAVPRVFKPQTTTSGSGTGCYKCHSQSHKVKNCPQRKAKQAAGKTARVGACAVQQNVDVARSDSIGGGQVSIAQPPAKLPSSADAVQPEQPRDLDAHTVALCVSNVVAEFPSTRSCGKAGCDCIEADAFHNRTYIEMKIENLAAHKALVDGGAEVCCIDANLVRHLK